MTDGSGVIPTDDGPPESLIHFTVYGEARPGGSKKAIHHRTTGRIIVMDASGAKGREWRKAIQGAAREAYDGPLLDEPLRVTFAFYKARPKNHYGSGKNADRIKDSAPRHPTTRPDALKLARAAEDALTGILWRDDSLIVDEQLYKFFAHDNRPCLKVWVDPA